MGARHNCPGIEPFKASEVLTGTERRQQVQEGLGHQGLSECEPSPGRGRPAREERGQTAGEALGRRE